MSTAAVSSSSIFQELQSFYQSRQTDLQQLGSALQSGDLNGAQQAFTALAVLGEGGPFANSEPFSKSSRAQAFNAIGEALQAGDLGRAQAAFATLTSQQSHSADAEQATQAAVVNLTSTQQSNATATDSSSSIYQQRQAYGQQRQADLNQLGQDLKAGDLNAALQDFSALTALGQSGPNKNGQLFQQADRAQDFQAIGQALQSGDLAGAQAAFASLAGTFGKHSHHSRAAISAYNSNSGAAEIVINLLSPASSTGTVPPTSVPPTVPPAVTSPAPVSVPPADPSSVPPTSTGTNAPVPGGSSIPEIVINLGGASNTSAASGSTTPELVINLGQGNGTSSASPEEITINLGSSGAQVSIDTAQGQNGSNAEQVTINLNAQSNYELILNLPNSNATSGAGNALSVQA